MKKQILAAAIAAIAMTTGAEAAVSVIGTQVAFSAAGTIVQNTNFDAFGSGFTLPGSPYGVGALTFVEGARNLIGGMTVYDFARPLFTDDSIMGTTVLVTGNYNMFGFNAGNFYPGTGTTLIEIVTNLGSYQFTPTTTGYGGGGSLTFLGYQAGPNEFFTSVRFSGPFATGGTDFQIGTLTPVPETASWALMIMGFGLAGAVMRRRALVAA